MYVFKWLPFNVIRFHSSYYPLAYCEQNWEVVNGVLHFHWLPFEQHGTVEKPAERIGRVNKDANTNIDLFLSQVKRKIIKEGSILIIRYH